MELSVDITYIDVTLAKITLLVLYPVFLMDQSNKTSNLFLNSRILGLSVFSTSAMLLLSHPCLVFIFYSKRVELGLSGGFLSGGFLEADSLVV